MAPAGDSQAGCDVAKTVLPVHRDLGRSPVTERLDLAAQVFPRFTSSSRMGSLSLSSFWGLSSWTRVVGGPGPEREGEEPWPGARCGRAQRPPPVPWGPAPLRAQGLPPLRHRLSHHDACEASCDVPVPTRPPQNLLSHGQEDTCPLQGLRAPGAPSWLPAVGHGCPDHGQGPKLGQEKRGQRESGPRDGRSSPQ